MRRWVWLAFALAALPAVASPARAARLPCTPPHARVVTANERIAVYRVERRAFVCSFVTGHRRALGELGPDVSDGAGLGPFAVRGDMVAFGSVVATSTDETPAVIVYDARRARIVVDVQAVPALGDEDPDRPFRFWDIGLTSGGAVAWIVRNTFAKPTRLEVYRAIGNHRVLLDAGPIAPRSLAIGARRAFWLRGDVARTCELVEGAETT